MNIPVFSIKEENGETWLSDETPDGHLTLRSQGERLVPGGEYNPWDVLVSLDPPMDAATIVFTWACEPRRTEQELAWAREYLSQWPEGPQADPGSIKEFKEDQAERASAAAELGSGPPYLNELAEFELRAKIEEMEEKLADCLPGSPMADMLETRIGMAKVFLEIKDPEFPRSDPEE